MLNIYYHLLAINTIRPNPGSAHRHPPLRLPGEKKPPTPERNQQLGDQVPAEDLEKKYLEDVVGASGDYDSED